MSKKDLLERLNRSPDGRASRRPEAAAARTRDDAVTTRVNKKVVRRRRKPGRNKSDDGMDASADHDHDLDTDLDGGVETDSESEVIEAAPVETAPVVVEEPPAPVAEAPSAPEPEPEPERQAEPEPVHEPEPVAETPERVPERRPEPEPEPVPVAQEPAAPIAAAPVAADAVGAGDEGGEKLERPDEPAFVGLGKAVVMPPPGYDPTNPHAWRRQQQAAQTAAPAAPARGRRRVDAGAGPGAARPERAPAGRAGRARPAGGKGRAGRTASRGQPATPFDRLRRKPRRKRGAGPKASSPAPKASKRKVRVDHVISVRDLARQLQIKAGLVIKTLMELGVMATITEMLDIDTAALVAAEFDYEVENVGFQEDEFLQHVEVDEDEENQETRPPVVTIMGHVDHGKTTLLDSIRSSRIASGEAGGITQHIGAYQVPQGDSFITFLDTPGHAAFSAMRARGASVTDIVVLVVAADDGVQPQTAEAIQHAKAAGVPIIVAVNKMDKPGVNPDAVKQQLTEYELIPEEWGGETMFVPVSALKGEGIDQLLEAIELQAEVLDLKANSDRHAEGVVIEAQMARGRGAVATVLVQQGTLSATDYVVLGSAFGRVRAMLDHNGKKVKTAGPSTPVELFGLSELPEVGDNLAVVANEKNARKLADHRAEQKRLLASAAGRRASAEELFAAAARGDLDKLHIVLKADVQGTLQAIKGALEQIEIEGTEINILLAAVGEITESDVNLAASDDAMLIGFNTKLDSKARSAADEKGVEAHLYSVIYALIEAVEARLTGMLAPEFQLVLNGKAEIRQLFRISKVGTIAGSYVTDGVIGRHDQAKVLRDGDIVWEGTISQLKRFKDDVREVKSGYECGISLSDFNELEEGDVIEAYRLEEVPPGS